VGLRRLGVLKAIGGLIGWQIKGATNAQRMQGQRMLSKDNTLMAFVAQAGV
jgi:hypothetical protein